MRSFGFYHPYGYKKNMYMVFYTGNQKKHLDVIKNQYSKLEHDGFFNTVDLIYADCGSDVLYSDVTYTDHKRLYNKLIERLLQDGNDITSSDKDSNIKAWSCVTLNKKKYANGDKYYLKNLLNNLDKE